ncbi:MAG: hypothetical protein K2W95_18905 [Candidatus Obscuribacterales bacterium]|nr:hypothetical protein [Candidatus Obscuribacterales bacterium]
MRSLQKTAGTAIRNFGLCVGISLLIHASASGSAPALAVNALTPERVRTLVQKLDILKPEARESVYATCDTALCTISLVRHPEATREDSKIDAVLVTRELTLVNPKLKLVRCLFYDADRQNTFWDIKVRASLVTAFGEGRINRNTLLHSVTLSEDKQSNPLSDKYRQTSYKSMLEQDSVAPGPFADNRLALALLLKSLSSSKIDTGQFRTDFLRIEDAARRGKISGLKTRIDSLDNRIEARVQELISTGQLPAPLTKLSRKTPVSLQQPSATSITK